MFQYKSVRMYDMEDEDLLVKLQTCCSFIEGARIEGGLLGPATWGGSSGQTGELPLLQLHDPAAAPPRTHLFTKRGVRAWRGLYFYGPLCAGSCEYRHM
jgi:hypothetical protein